MNINLAPLKSKLETCATGPQRGMASIGGLHEPCARWLFWVKWKIYNEFYAGIGCRPTYFCMQSQACIWSQDWMALEFWSRLWKKVNIVASGLAWGFNCWLRCQERFRPDSWFLSGSELRPLYLVADLKRFTVLSFFSASRRHVCENPEPPKISAGFWNIPNLAWSGQ